MTDKINPDHYNGDDCMVAIASITRGLVGAEAFCIGTAIKYLWRAGKKNGETWEEDVKKARWYMTWIRGRTGVLTHPSMLVIEALVDSCTSEEVCADVRAALSELASVRARKEN